MNDKSIYKVHYQGTTYWAGVAYLRARSRADDRAPSRNRTLTLNQQRDTIAEAARAMQMIIVAEFIDYGPDRPGLRPGMNALLAFAENTHVRSCLVADHDYVASNDTIKDFWNRHFQLARVDLFEATEV